MAEATFQLGNLSAKKDPQSGQKTEAYYRMAAEAGHVNAMLMLGDWYNYDAQLSAGEVYTLAAERGNVDIKSDPSEQKKAEQYYTMAADKGDLSVMNDLAGSILNKKRNKQRSLQYIRRLSPPKKISIPRIPLVPFYLWNNRPDEAFELAEFFMYDEKAYEAAQKTTLFCVSMMLLLAKQYTNGDRLF